MSDLQGRSRRLRKSGSYSSNGSSHSQSSPASRKRRRRPAAPSVSRGGQRRGTGRPDASNQRSKPSYDPRQSGGGLVQNPPGAIVKANTSYQSRDGRHIPLGPDLRRRRPQVGTYAPAFNGQRAPASDRYSSPAKNRNLNARYEYQHTQALPSFPGAEAVGTYRPTQRLHPRPVAQPKRQGRLARVPKKIKRPTPPIVYVIRLLILGIGIGAIAGTIISFFDPSQTEPSIAQSGASTSGLESSADDSTSTNPLSSIPRVNSFGQSLASPMQLGQEMTSLQTTLQGITERYSGLNPGVFLYDLDTTNYLSINGDVPFSAASTIKTPILVAFFQDVEAGRLTLDDVLTMRQSDVGTGSGDMQYEPVGTQYSALEIATKMIVISDNTATNILVRKMGGANALNQRFQSWGLTSTAIRNPLPDLEGTNTTSPKDMVTLMTLVSRGELLSLRSRDQMLHIMERTQTNTLLPQGIGSGAQIAHKTGDIGSMVGDVGLVDMPNGKRYAVTALVQRPHNDPRAQELIRQVSRTIYQALETTYEPQSLSNPSNESSPSSNPRDPRIDNPEFFGVE